MKSNLKLYNFVLFLKRILNKYEDLYIYSCKLLLQRYENRSYIPRVYTICYSISTLKTAVRFLVILKLSLGKDLLNREMRSI